MYKKCDVNAAIRHAYNAVLKNKELLNNLTNDEERALVLANEFRKKLEHMLEQANTFQLYSIDAKLGYDGISFVAATDAENANHYIDVFKDVDKHNASCSEGYSSISEMDRLEGVFCDAPGFVYHGIRKL